jgi:deoxycytidine triphosphate deaminase
MNKATKKMILEEIEQLKRDKPENWKRKAGQLVRLITHEEIEIPHFNADSRGFETVGRKCRSTKISPPF